MIFQQEFKKVCQWKKKNETAPAKSELILYQTQDGKTKVEVRLQDETVWLSQKLMAELFQKDVRTINEHIKNIYEEGELVRSQLSGISG